MSYQNFNTNIADPINYGVNKFESINTSSNFKIDFHKTSNYNSEYKKVGIVAQILALFFIIGVISSIVLTAISIHSF